MDKYELLPLPLPPGNITLNTTFRKRVALIRRFAIGFVILGILGLLYIPAYNLVQGPYSGLGEASSPVTTLGTRIIASVVPLQGWGMNTSRNVGNYICPQNITTIINPENICLDKPYLLVVVCSAVTNYNARAAIRSTWGNTTLFDISYNAIVKVVFLLGQSKNDVVNSNITEESHLYNDIIQERFYDTYNNLTLKSVMLLKWVTLNCNKLVYAMKTDDDMYVNLPTLIKVLRSKPNSNNTLMGTLICNAKPITDSKNKWYSPKYMFSGKTYPNYLSGTGYVMSLDVVYKLYQTTLEIPIFHLEDVYITGICAKYAKVRPVNQYGFSYETRKLETCSLRESITAHRITIPNMYKIWNVLNGPNVICKSRPNIQNTTSKIALSRSRFSRHFNHLKIQKRIVNKCV